MRTVVTKIPNDDYEKLREVCGKRGLSIYECLRYLVYRFLEESGCEPVTIPLELRVEKLEKQVAELRKQVEALVSKIYSTSKGMDRFIKRR